MTWKWKNCVTHSSNSSSGGKNNDDDDNLRKKNELQKTAEKSHSESENDIKIARMGLRRSQTEAIE